MIQTAPGLWPAAWPPVAVAKIAGQEAAAILNESCHPRLLRLCRCPVCPCLSPFSWGKAVSKDCGRSVSLAIRATDGGLCLRPATVASVSQGPCSTANHIHCKKRLYACTIDCMCSTTMAVLLRLTWLVASMPAPAVGIANDVLPAFWPLRERLSWAGSPQTQNCGARSLQRFFASFSSGATPALGHLLQPWSARSPLNPRNEQKRKTVCSGTPTGIYIRIAETTRFQGQLPQ